jgi:hypothetical protein
VAQTVFDVALESITMPVLVVFSRLRPLHPHATRPRRPHFGPHAGQREQTVKVTGGPGGGGSGLEGCEGKAPHGFVGQDAEVAAGIARFVRGGTY